MKPPEPLEDKEPPEEGKVQSGSPEQEETTNRNYVVDQSRFTQPRAGSINLTKQIRISGEPLFIKKKKRAPPCFPQFGVLGPEQGKDPLLNLPRWDVKDQPT
ncbi:hypothetical protein J6590_049681 [Homalodisca vitripennis]|nr:hypothetical protein J6590_049681 [Homalodisca vitripennis]